jgi:hypothetical protein
MSTQGHYEQPDSDIDDGQQVPIDAQSIALVSDQEINRQIATAKRYPRSLTSFRRQAMEMVSLNAIIAGQCTYVLPRKTQDGKRIEGPSARFAEIVYSCWGNCRASARVTDIGDEYITAEGIFYDLEKNNAIRYEVLRRITNKDGERYGADMIGVTGNAACAIAIRNAILKGIPKAFWNDIHEKAKVVAAGDDKTFNDRKAEVIRVFKDLGVLPAQLYELLEIKGSDDLNTEHLLTLAGILTAIQEGDTSIEATFGKAHGHTHAQGGQQRPNEFSRPNGSQGGPQAHQQAQPQPPQPKSADPQAAPQQAPVAVQGLPAPDTMQRLPEQVPPQPKPEEVKTVAQGTAEVSERSKEDRLKDTMRDYIADKTIEMRATCKRVSQVTDILLKVKEEFGDDHWVYGEMAKITNAYQEELVAALTKPSARKGK